MKKLDLINDKLSKDIELIVNNEGWGGNLKVVNHNGRLDIIATDTLDIEDKLVREPQKQNSSGFNQELIGSWFLYKDSDGCLFVTKDKPTLTDNGCFLGEVRQSGWMSLALCNGDPYHNDKFTCGNWTLISGDFNALKLPRVTEHSIKEIEIMPSGKVYFY